MQIKPRQLEAFRQVMLRGSVTAAAERLNVSQPAVSRLVRDLEARTGLTLFERHGNHIVPTPEAGLLLAEVERYALGLEAVATFASELKHRRRGTLRVVALPAMAMGFLPRFLAGFVKARDQTSVHVHGMPSHLAVEAVASGNADVALASASFERPGLAVETILGAAVLVVPRGHRLARRRSAGAADLRGENMVELVDTLIMSGPRPAEVAEALHGARLRTPLSGIACSLVAAGAGIALVDPFSASDFADRGLVAVPFAPAIEVRVAIVTSANRRLSALSQEFVDAFRVHAAASFRRTAGKG